MMKLLIIVAFILLSALLEAWAEPAVTIRVRPMVLIARGDVRLEVRVIPDKRNYLLVIEWNSEDGNAGQSVRQLDGDDSPILFEFWMRDVVPANYEISAKTYDGHGKIIATAWGRVSKPEAR